MTDPKSAAAHAAQLVAAGEKTLVVARARKDLLVVAGALAAHDVPFRMITAGMPASERAAVLAESHSQTIVVLATDSVLGGMSFAHCFLVHADDPETLQPAVLHQREGRVHRPVVRARQLTGDDRSARDTSRAWAGTAGPLAVFASTGAIAHTTDLLAEVDTYLTGVTDPEVGFDDPVSDDAARQLTGLRQYLQERGPRLPLSGWAQQAA